MNILYSTVNTLRDRYTPVSHSSTFRTTGQLTPEEFVAAGDYLVFKFPTWSWADAVPESRRVSHLPPGKQFLVTRDVPCNRRLDDDFAGGAGKEATVVDGEGIAGKDEDDDGWLRTGGVASPEEKQQEHSAVDSKMRDEDEDDIPDMDEEDDDAAIIKDAEAHAKTSGRRKYSLYIMYSPAYKTPRLYLSGYLASGEPLPPHLMMDDIVGDYKDKTVTLEDFPFFAHSVKMASVHPCKHASVMKTLLDRADAALRLRRDKLRRGKAVGGGLEGLVDDEPSQPSQKQVGTAPDEWEEVDAMDVDDGEVAIRVDQYLVVFLKFMASVTPGIEHDFTMGL